MTTTGRKPSTIRAGAAFAALALPLVLPLVLALVPVLAGGAASAQTADATRLMAAAAADDAATVRALVEAGTPPDVVVDGSAPVIAAIEAGGNDALEALLDADYTIAIRPVGVATPLNAAILARQPRIVRTLLDRGAFPLMADGEGRTPRALAEASGDAALVAMIEAAEAGIRAFIGRWTYEAGGYRVTYDIRATDDADRILATDTEVETVPADIVWNAYNRIALQSVRETPDGKVLERLFCRITDIATLDCGLQFGWRDPVVRFFPEQR